MQAPEWNEQNKAGSLNQWIETLNDEARRQYLEAGTHSEIFFIFNDTGLMEVVPVVGMDKNEEIRELKKMLATRNGYAFIHISEGTMRTIDNSDEAEVLLVQAESHDGLSAVWCSTITTRGEQKLLLDAVEIDGSKLSGRFAHIFQSL